jgi:hypothetical protein
MGMQAGRRELRLVPMLMTLHKLSQEQVALYDAHLVDERGMEIICSAIEHWFRPRPAHFQ